MIAISTDLNLEIYCIENTHWGLSSFPLAHLLPTEVVQELTATDLDMHQMSYSLLE